MRPLERSHKARKRAANHPLIDSEQQRKISFKGAQNGCTAAELHKRSHGTLPNVAFTRPLGEEKDSSGLLGTSVLNLLLLWQLVYGILRRGKPFATDSFSWLSGGHFNHVTYTRSQVGPRRLTAFLCVKMRPSSQSKVLHLLPRYYITDHNVYFFFQTWKLELNALVGNFNCGKVAFYEVTAEITLW